MVQLLKNFNYIIIVYTALMIFTFTVSTLYALYKVIKEKNRDKRKLNITKKRFTIIIPAYNEEKCIVQSVETNLNIDYDNYELIVINDGSNDLTLNKLKIHFDLYESKIDKFFYLRTNKVKQIYKSKKYENLIVIDKKNGGKSDSLNTGINYASGEIVCTVDADTILNYNSINKINKKFFQNSKIIVVGGHIKLSNDVIFDFKRKSKLTLSKNHLVRFQFVEYIRAFFIGRLLFSSINTLMISSGAFTSFRKDILLEVNGFDSSTIGEDMELVIRIHSHMLSKKEKYYIKYLHDAICWTQAPSNLNDLKNQRIRWQIGLIDSLVKHKKMLFHTKYKKIGFLGMPYFQFFEMYSSIIEMIGYFVVVISYFLNILSIYALYYYISITLFGIFLTVIILFIYLYSTNSKEEKKYAINLMFYSILENIGYRQLMLFYRIIGIFQFKKKKNYWKKISREKIDIKNIEYKV